MSAPDVPTDVMRKMIRVFSSYPELEMVTLFGSRAVGKANPWSDIDLATHGIVGDRHRLGRLALDLDETSIPQTCDVMAYEAISYAPLRRHVNNVGIIIYRRAADGRSHYSAVRRTAAKTDGTNITSSIGCRGQ